jgi:hypothetical protein
MGKRSLQCTDQGESQQNMIHRFPGVVVTIVRTCSKRTSSLFHKIIAPRYSQAKEKHIPGGLSNPKCFRYWFHIGIASLRQITKCMDAEILTWCQNESRLTNHGLR